MKRSRYLPVIVLFALAALLTTGCDALIASTGGTRGSGNVISETRDVSGFTVIELNTSGNAVVTVGDVDSLTIEAEDNILPLLTSEVRNGVLVLGTEPNSSFSSTRNIIYTITVANLDAVTLNGSGNLTAGTLAGEQMVIAVNGSGSVDIADVSGNDLTVTISGSGSVTVAGSVTSQDVHILGSGGYNGFDLASNSATIVTDGSGNAQVNVADTLDATSNGSGSVIYAGGPQVNAATNGSGDVRAR
ncbi:MAG: DUF2807 domain-containing protein [Anaerolineae bacterium]|nr:DUF2807 domain-containing protein [Anaerolineae bacterium]